MEQSNEKKRQNEEGQDGNDYNSAEAWQEWEEEMKQYEGWETHANHSLSVTSKRARTDGYGQSSQVKDVLVSQLLEDVEARTMIVETLVEAGVDTDIIQSLFSQHIRTFVLQKQSNSSQGGRIYLVHDPERNLHVSVFGCGWLAFLLRQRGQDIEAYDSKEQEDGTFIAEWQRWPWSDAVTAGSFEKLESADEGRSLILWVLAGHGIRLRHFLSAAIQGEEAGIDPPPVRRVDISDRARRST
ncbi:hypothetical protein GUITHDRAFT_101713 [Guillardia theta CCMP2712]|uniref:Uncharacterized protein n=1 Tax=Guillardia theta (strain CCMP2712) TaxID=905079 RepID=L1JVD5_GUITC|nr:hypothetical protein GUITHDRAFT_101713 [Guillardia theta CCMP2712]EKX52546.1 hypothetical protein GUITHDRAFT_101713 [Guillardia theta CCMP2712]|eukprot:XP_005839526.1 hypothetical protein GUITHDRAFT_101713 [Guillardia theta CCMP2712]